jgi:hypothetical protein
MFSTKPDYDCGRRRLSALLILVQESPHAHDVESVQVHVLLGFKFLTGTSDEAHVCGGSGALRLLALLIPQHWHVLISSSMCACHNFNCNFNLQVREHRVTAAAAAPCGCLRTTGCGGTSTRPLRSSARAAWPRL